MLHLIKASSTGLSEPYPIIFLEGKRANPKPGESILLFDTYEGDTKLISLRLDEYMSNSLVTKDGELEFISSYSTKSYTK